MGASFGTCLFRAPLLLSPHPRISGVPLVTLGNDLWDCWGAWVMAKNLSAEALLFLDWLLDPRPTTVASYEEDGVTVSEGSPGKGSQVEWCRRHGVATGSPANWRKDVRFQAAYRKAVESEVRDPTYMLEVIRTVRGLATGDAVASPSEVLKAADLYGRLTGYQAPEVPKVEKAAKELSDEELLLKVAEEERAERGVAVYDA